MVACIQKYILIYFPGDSFRSTPKQVYTINKHTFINTKDGHTQSATDIRENQAYHRACQAQIHRSHGPYSKDRFRRNIQYTKHRFRRNTLTKHRFRRNTLTKHRLVSTQLDTTTLHLTAGKCFPRKRLSVSHACSLSSPMAISSGKKKSVLLNMRRPLNRGRQLSSLEPIWPPGSSHYGGGAQIEPLWRGSPPHTRAKLLLRQ